MRYYAWYSPGIPLFVGLYITLVPNRLDRARYDTVESFLSVHLFLLSIAAWLRSTSRLIFIDSLRYIDHLSR